MSSSVQELLYISIVNKVCTELENNVHIRDKDLAEFIVSLHQESKNIGEFKEHLQENGAEFASSFVENLFRIITAMTPKTKPKAALSQPAAPKSKHPDAEKLSGLAIPDTAPIQLEVVNPDAGRNLQLGRRGRRDNRQREGDRQRDRARDRRREDDRRGRDARDRDYEKRDRRDRGRDRRDRSRSPRRRDGRDQRGRGVRGSKYGDPGDQNHRAPPEAQVKPRGPRALERYEIYDGEVSSVKDFGCFVRLKGVQVDGRPVEGLVQRGFLTRDNVNPLVKNYVKRGQKVKVKAISIIKQSSGVKIGLSMRSVDQKTGRDLVPHGRDRPGALTKEDFKHNPSRPKGKGIDLLDDEEAEEQRFGRHRKRLSSVERYEMAQLVRSGAMSVSERPDFDDHTGVLDGNTELDEELDIELNEREPNFLKGQTSASMDHDPVRVVKNPDGSLQRAALTQSALMKERREIRQQKQNQEADLVPTNMSQAYQDPMSRSTDRLLAQSLMNKMPGKSLEDAPWMKETNSQFAALGRKETKTLLQQRMELPIYRLKNELLRAVKDNDIIIVIGETGSGKTTQIPQYLADAGYTSQGVVGITQPRRVAAMSVAKRVSEEFGCRLGQEVGYSIRFEDMTSPETMLKYMTDGMLLRECLMDPDLRKYSVIMLDEAHERTIHTDVMMALLKKCTQRRNDKTNELPKLKLIVTSATLESEKYSDYFCNCPIFTIPGRSYPVTILYSREPEEDYLDCSLITVLNIHLSEPAGDILLFLTGKEEIDTACEILYDRVQNLRGAPPLLILPVYSALPSEMQARIFEPTPPGCRKVVIATNIAEASLTIDGIYFVIDPGFVKQKVYNAKLGMDSLVITPISQQSGKQRAGRAGRTGPGKCYRLYTQIAYQNEMLAAAVPEIQRTDLGNVVLSLKAMGVNNLLEFDFMDAPPQATLITAMQELYNLGALDEEGLLTRLGRKMAEFPLDPHLSKILIASEKLKCTEEMLTIVAMLSSDNNIWFRPREKQAVADQKRARFFQSEGDHVTMLYVYECWKNAKYSNPWCQQNFLQSRAMRHGQDVRKQLVAIMDRYGIEQNSCGKKYIRVLKAIVSGYFMNAAKKDPQEGYKNLTEGQPVYIHPSSALFNHQPEWLIYHNLVLTTKEYMRECIAIEPKWLIQLAPRFFKKADPLRMSRRKKREKIEPLYNRWEDENMWRLSRRGFQQ